ncbi:MAG: hypothetical protein J0M05_13610 [Candidatus Kapabacteria bacterium]|jgi:hypothetical protein|nr:hypothetical protein [Candidatus Kapabacteria bacterium]
MRTLTIESNGRIEKTAIYINGEQIAGIKELFLNLDEDGTFDAVIQYEGKDKIIYNKALFSDYLEQMKTREPSFSDEEASELQQLTIESDGEIENSVVLINEEIAEGLVNVLIHIKAGANTEKSGFMGLFKGKQSLAEGTTFKVEATFRNEDDTLETERIFS